MRNEESPARHTLSEWNTGDATPNQTPSRDNSAQNTPRNTPTQQQQQNRNQQQNQHVRNAMTPAASIRDRRVVRGADEQNGNQNANGRIERGPNSGTRRPNRSNRNRNNVVSSNDRRTDPPQPSDLPRGYGMNQTIQYNFLKYNTLLNKMRDKLFLKYNKLFKK